jgi:site-specific DNA recombinase
MMAKALAYIRVSTQEQADKGFSVDGQKKELIPAIEAQGYEIAAVITDAGYSRDTLDRPGIDEILDYVVTGEIDAIWAWKRDRYGASPCPEILASQLDEYDTKLRALDDSGTGDDADFINGIKDLIAKRELRTTVARSRMGRLQKARAGMVIANNAPDYGFRYNATRDGYEIDPETMPVVRRIFHMLAEGQSLNGIVQTLNAEGIRPPGITNKSGRWGTDYISKCLVPDDVYRPHTYDEIRDSVTAEVAATLDPDRLYGIWYYNRYRTKTTKTTVPDGMGGKKQKRQHKRRELPRSEWIAVPVPAAGIPLEVIEAAREAISNNQRFASKAGGREWELSGGVARCGECGRAMTARPVNSRGKPYYYYYCTHAQGKQATCDNKKNVPAGKLERRVADLVADILSNEDRLISEIDAVIEKERGKLRNPEPEVAACVERISEIARKRDKYQEMYTADAMTIDELKSKLIELEEHKADAEMALKQAEGRSERLAELERDRADLQRIYRERALENGLADFTAEQRREVYRRLKLAIYVHADQSVGVAGDIPLTVSYFDSPWTVTDMNVDSHGYSATYVFKPQSGSLVCENQEWTSVHSQSNSQDSSRFTGAS